MKYKISELAKLLDISTNTVRRYEDKGYISAVRGESSGYRYYDDDGIFGIVNAKLLRKYGFTHEKLQEMKGISLQETMDAYAERMSDIDSQIAYLTYLQHRMKDDCLLMYKAMESTQVYEKDSVQQVYVLYKEGEKLLHEKERLDKIHEFLYNSPEVQHIYIIPKAELDKGRFTLCCGWAVKQMHMDKYGMTENMYTRRYESVHSVMGFVKIPATLSALAACSEEEQEKLIIGKHLEYMKRNKMVIAGDIMCVIITRAVENGTDMLYMLVSVPVARAM